jgi:hypothetical protein
MTFFIPHVTTQVKPTLAHSPPIARSLCTAGFNLFGINSMHINGTTNAMSGTTTVGTVFSPCGYEYRHNKSPCTKR